jgi:hypothetical protein
MREWILAAAPVIAVVFFVVYPASFNSLMSWFVNVLH